MQDLKQGKLIIFLKSTALKYISRFSFCFFTSIAKINVWFYYPLKFLEALTETLFLCPSSIAKYHIYLASDTATVPVNRKPNVI